MEVAMGNDVPFLWFLEPGFLVFALVVGGGWAAWRWWTR
jgi:hypothetical protein